MDYIMDSSRHSLSGRTLLLRSVCVLYVLLVVVGLALGRPAKWSAFSEKRSLHKSDYGMTRMKRNLEHLRNLLKRSSYMDATQKSYKDFYQKLRSFTSGFLNKLKAGAPDNLKQIVALTQIIGPNDSAFKYLRSYDAAYVNKKVSTTIDYTNVTLQNVAKFVKNSAKKWLMDQKQALQSDIFIVKNDLFMLKHFGQTSVSGAQTGIGGINEGVNKGIELKVLDKLAKLFQALKS